ncbi:MAG: uroporphyrinogen-III synthase [Polyangiaceae bacterium]|nr:uroporphyrinogen-III synthase [Polyangiaceae bacterium]
MARLNRNTSELLAGLRIVSFESRRADDIVRLVNKRGGECLRAPSMTEVSLAKQEHAFRFFETLADTSEGVLVLLTGVGARMMFQAMCSRYPEDEVRARLAPLTVICRGPKAAKGARDIGLSPTATAPEPNTWRELATTLDEQLDVSGRPVFIQEYGMRRHELIEHLERGGAAVTPIPIYAWELPPDITELQYALREITARRIDAVMFTSGHQVVNVLLCARELGIETALREVLESHSLIASVGPVTSDVLREHQLTPDIEPVHPKMGHLIVALSEEASSLLQAKRGGSPKSLPPD